MPNAKPNGGRGGTVSVLAVRALLSYAKTCGVDVKGLTSELAIDPAVLADPDGRVSIRVYHRAMELAAARSHDPAFGLHAAEQAGLGTFEALDYALWASATLEDAFDRLIRFSRVVSDDLPMHLIKSGKWIRLQRAVGHELRHRSEAVAAGITVRARELVGRPFRLHEVRFVHPAPRDVRPHRALFRCPVRFGCAAQELVFAADQLGLPVKTSKPGLATVLDRHLRDLLARLPGRGSIVHRVEHAIARTLHQGRPSLAATARALHASPRTIQRNLKEIGVTYRELVEDVRRDRADRLLAVRRVSITEVAYLLGFEDVSGFRRAYRKWTGTNPSRARRRE